MVESERSSPHPVEALGYPRADVLVSSYLGEIYTYKALQYAQAQRDAHFLNQVAKSYGDFPDRLRNLFDTILEQQNFPAYQVKKPDIERTIALSFARSGDSQRADEMIYNGKSPLLPVAIAFVIEYADICTEQGGDPSDLYRIAKEVSVGSQDALSWLEKIANSQVKNKQDPQGTLEEYNRIRKRKGNIPSLTYAKLLIHSGRVEDGTQILEQECKDPATFDHAMQTLRPEIAEALIARGDIQEAITTLIPPDYPKELSAAFTTLSKIILKKETITPGDAVLFETHDELFERLKRNGPAPMWVRLQKTEVDLLRGEDISQTLEALSSSIDTTYAVDVVPDIRKIIALAAKAGIHTDLYIGKLNKAITEMINQIDFTDKVSPIEAVMAYEETVHSLVNQGYLREALGMAELYERVFSSDNNDNPVTETEFTQEAYLRISQQYIARAKNSDNNDSKNRQDENRNHMLKAIGYFGLSHDAANLNASERILVEIGRRERLIVEGREDLLDEMDLSQEGLSPRTYAVGIRDSIDTNAFHLLRTQLRKELADNNPQDVRRLVKELLEVGDTEIHAFATEMFIDPTQPMHFRVYLAKKLCDEKVWDRQILFYFRQYQQAAESMPAASEKIETLEAIIRQMHQTPHLEMYKVLEKTRQERDPAAMEKVAQFGAEAFLIDGFDLGDRIKLFSYWADQYTEGKLSEKRLDELTQQIRSLGNAWLAYYELHSKFDKHNNVKVASREFLQSSEMFAGLEEARALFEQGIFPTKRLMQRMQGVGAISELEVLQNRTEDGDFDRENQLQRDLEFTNFLKIARTANLSTLRREFERLSSSDQSLRQPELTYQEKYEASAAAYECALLYWFVRGLVDNGRNVVVVGNKRYGDYFVTEPLRSHFAKLGVNIRSLYVRSSVSSEHSYPEDIPDTFIRLLSDDAPDIVIVDGAKHTATPTPRLPKSFLSFRNWFEVFNDAQKIDDADLEFKSTNPRLQRLATFHPKSPYHIRFWTPSGSKRILLGDREIDDKESDDDLPSVYFVNSVIYPPSFTNYPTELRDHKPNYFDDPDTHIIGNEKIVFTPYGVKNTGEKFLLEEAYVREVQYEIERKIPEYIRRTDPLTGLGNTDEHGGGYRFSPTS